MAGFGGVFAVPYLSRQGSAVQYDTVQCWGERGKQGTVDKHSTNMQIPIQLCRTMHAVSVDKECTRDKPRFPGRESFFTFPANLEYQYQFSGRHHWHECTMSSVGPCLNDDSLGPAVRGCRGNFDFTVAFEDVVFVIVPAIAFICLGFLRISKLCRCHRPIVGLSAFQWTKLVCISTLVNASSCLKHMPLTDAFFIVV